MAIECSKKRWALFLVPLLLIIIALVVVGVYFWVNNGNDNDDGTTMRPEVTISQGTLRGVNMVTYYGRSIFGFIGIPFAQPPVGNLRFAAPVAPDAWSGTLDASSDSNTCPQSITGGAVTGDEDCLYLNVFTPSLPTSENSTLLPVMVFIYGGAFRVGSNNVEEFNPDFLLDKDVVLVVPNYRLGVLGFISTGDEVVPGNSAMKDIVRALEWNRDNIEYFGGDPNRVTIFGQSAGGISVHLMAFSNLTEGLFHRYIVESGAAFALGAQKPLELMVNRTNQLGEFLGCSTNTSTELVDCLRGKTLTQLLIEPASLFEVYNGSPRVVWGPSREPDVEGAFITDRPVNLVAAGNFHDVPFIVCVNRDEGNGFYGQYLNDPDAFETFLDDIDIALPPYLAYDYLVANVTAYTEGLKSFFANDLTVDRSILLTNLTELIGEAINVYPAYASNQLLLNSQSPHYFAYFEYHGTFSHASTNDYAVAHMDELLYLFQPVYSNFGSGDAEMNDDDLQMVETMVQLWTSFATTGTPTTTVASTNTVWEQYSSSKNYLRIGNYSDPSIVVEYNFLENHMDFWEELTAATTWL